MYALHDSPVGKEWLRTGVCVSYHTRRTRSCGSWSWNGEPLEMTEIESKLCSKRMVSSDSCHLIGCGYQLPLKMFLVSWVYTGQIVLSGTKHN